MLNNYKGGDEVKAGFYYSAKRWTIELVDKKGGVLSGAADEKYTRLPVPVMLVVAPVLGAAFVIFLPLIGFLMLGVVRLAPDDGPPAGAHRRGGREESGVRDRDSGLGES